MPQASIESKSSCARTSEGKAAEVERLIAAALSDTGYEIVRVLLSGDRRAKLQIMVERHDGSGMTVDDCATISRAVAAILDVEDPIAGTYVLEVSSPGIDRPLTRLSDFERFAGFEARVETRMPIEGRRRFRGRLMGFDGERVRLTVNGGEITIDFDEIAKAKLVITDERLAASGRADSN